MALNAGIASAAVRSGPPNFAQLLDPLVLADPYPLYRRLREERPIYWDSFLHAWVVTPYSDVQRVLHEFSANRTPAPDKLAALGLSDMSGVAELMVNQMLFMDPPAHSRIRAFASNTFMPQRVALLKEHVTEVVERLLDRVEPHAQMDVIVDFAEPLPCIITAEMLGVPVEDAPRLKCWSQDFAEVLGNFQHNPDRAPRLAHSVKEMSAYFSAAVSDIGRSSRPGLIHDFLSAPGNGDHLTHREVVANVILTMVGGQETTTNLIANGVLTLLRHPPSLALLRQNPSLIATAVEELLRYEPPSQYTARIAPDDVFLGAQLVRKGQAVIAVMAAANRDPQYFTEPERLDIERRDNRHLSFGWAAHFCFGAALARIEAQVAFGALLRRFSTWSLQPRPLAWRTNLGLRGLQSLHIALRANTRGASLPGSQPFNGSAPEAKNDFGSRATPQDTASREQLVNLILQGKLADREVTTNSPTACKSARASAASLFQEQVLTRARSASDPSLYNETITVHRSGPLNVPLLERAFARIVRRHEAWRTSFDLSGGLPVQVIHPPSDVFEIPVTDLRGFPRDRRDAEALRLVNDQARLPLDLHHGPLLRPCLIQMDDDDYRLVITAHQSIVDGISAYQILPFELSAFYEELSSDRPAQLPELPIQYRDFSAWHRHWLESGAAEAQFNYWREKIPHDSPSPLWPPSPKESGPFWGSVLSFVVPPSASHAAIALAHSHRVPLFQLLLSAFAALLYKYSDQTDLLLGTFAPSGRNHSETANLLGYFLNPVALRYRVSVDSSFREIALQTRTLLSEAISNADIPMDSLFERLWPEQRHRPVVRAAISLQPRTEPVAPHWSITTMDAATGSSFWDFYLAFIEAGDSLTGRVQFNACVLHSKMVTTALSDLWHLLDAASRNPELPLKELLA